MGVKPIVTASALAIGFGALWATPAFTGGSVAAAAAEGQPKAAPNDTSRRVCRNLIRSGTRLSTRYCRTRPNGTRPERARAASFRGPGKRPARAALSEPGSDAETQAVGKSPRVEPCTAQGEH